MLGKAWLAICDKFMELPVWARWFVAIFAFFSIFAICEIWGESRPVAAYAEQLIATLLYWTMVIGSFFLGILVGIGVTKRTGMIWLGWLVGIAAIL